MKAIITQPIKIYHDGIFIPMHLKLVEQVRQLTTKEKPLDIEIAIHRNKRSLNANSYMWVVCTKIAEVLFTSKDEVYETMIRRYGVCTYAVFKKEMVEKIKSEWRIHDDLGEVLVKGQSGIQLRLYIGSSQYNTKEMSVLIDGIVSEAKELGIETATPAELQQLKDEWRKEND